MWIIWSRIDDLLYKHLDSGTHFIVGTWLIFSIDQLSENFCYVISYYDPQLTDKTPIREGVACDILISADHVVIDVKANPHRFHSRGNFSWKALFHRRGSGVDGRSIEFPIFSQDGQKF